MRLLLFLLFSVNLFSQGWDKDNAPGRFRLVESETYEDYKKAYEFDGVSSGSVDFSKGKYWHGYHYPYRKGSLYLDGDINVMDKLRMANDSILANHLTSIVDSLTHKNDGLDWGGNCQGFSATSIEYVEPVDTIVNGILFTSDEIKSLLAYYYNDISKYNIPDVIGSRCKNLAQTGPVKSLLNQLEGNDAVRCDPINAGSFHIALKRMLDNNQKGFVMDMDKSNHVWNVPVVGYNSKTLEKIDENNYIIETEIQYIWYTRPGDKVEDIRNITVEYVLNVDNEGYITGGSWTSDNYPDFIWSHGNPLPKPNGMWNFLRNFVK